MGSNPPGKKFLFILFSIAILGALGTGFVGTTVAGPDCGDYEYEGDGDEENPYEIEDVYGLQCIENDLDSHYALQADIDASDTEDWNDGDGFNPIGDDETGFTGSFDGQGNTIFDLTINRNDENNVGLFGLTGDRAIIENIRLENTDIEGDLRVAVLVGSNSGTVNDVSATGTVHGRSSSGGLVGSNTGEIHEAEVGVDVYSDGSAGGLVSRNSGDGTVKNSHATGAVEGGNSVGGLIGTNWNRVEQSSAAGDVTGHDDTGGLIGSNTEGIVTDSHAEGDVVGDQSVGGLIGDHRQGGEVHRSYATGSVSGDEWVGGIAGYQYSGSDTETEITESFATGNVEGSEWVGGLVGYNRDSTVSDSFASGFVSGDDTVGGVVGRNAWAGEVHRSFATGTVTGDVDIGGLVGENTGTSEVSDSYWDVDRTGHPSGVGDNSGDFDSQGLLNPEMVGEAAVENLTALDFWGTWETVTDLHELADSDSYPILQALDAEPQLLAPEVESQFVRAPGEEEYPDLLGGMDGIGTDGDPYVITNLSELQAVSGDLSAHYELGNDIDATETKVWYSDGGSGFTPIESPFTGTFDGEGHEIIGLTIDRPNDDEVGLFSYAEGTTIENVKLRGVDIEGSGGGVGSLVGYVENDALIRNVEVSGAVSDQGSGWGIGGLAGYAYYDVVIEDVYTEVKVSGDWAAGGLVGEFGDSLVYKSSSSGDVEGGGYLGGLLGFDWATESGESEIIESHATGDVTGTDWGVGGLIGGHGSDTIDSYATGTVESDNDAVGGLIGEHYWGNVTGSFATGDVSGQNEVGGLTGFDSANVSMSAANGTVEGDEFVGGVTGGNWDHHVKNTFATGTVSGSNSVGGVVGANSGTVTESYAVGHVSGDDKYGGIVGHNDDGNLIASYFDTETTEQADGVGQNDGLIEQPVDGLPTDEMTGNSAVESMSAFDFTNVWETVSDQYPTLRAITAFTITDDKTVGSTSENDEDDEEDEELEEVPTISVLPSSIDFDLVDVGDEETETLTIENLGAEDLTISDLSIDGNDAFTLDGAISGVAPGDEETVDIVFEPKTGQLYKGLVAIESNDPDTDLVEVDLEGVGADAAFELEEDTIDFGTVAVDGNYSETVTVWNNGTAPLDVKDLSMDGDDAFSVEDDSLTVDAGEQETVRIRYSPTEIAEHETTLIFEKGSDDLGTVDIVGEARERALRVDPESLDFGNHSVGEQTTEEITITTDEDIEVGIDDVHISSGDDEVFTVEDGESTVGPDDEVERTITFAPERPGDYGATVAVFGPDGREGDVDLRAIATAPEMSVQPGSIQFGDVEVDDTATETVTVENTGDEGEALEVRNAILRDNTAFSLEGGGDFDIEPGENHTLDITFSPETEDQQTTQLTLRSNDPVNRNEIVYVSSGNVEANVTLDEEDRVTTTAVIRDAKAGEPARLDLPSPIDEERYEMENLEITPEEDGDIEINITSSSRKLDSTPEDRTGFVNATSMRGNLSVDSTLDRDQIQEVSFEYTMDSQELEDMDSSPEDVDFYRFDEDEGRWEQKPTEIVAENDEEVTFRSTGSGFSEWTAAAQRPDFDVTDTQIEVTAAEVDQELLIQVIVTNWGGADGTYEAELLFDDEVVDSEDRTVPANGTVPINFERSFDEAGLYEVLVNDVFIAEVDITDPGDAEVEQVTDEVPAPLEEARGEEGVDESDDGSGWLTVGLGLVALGILAAAGYLIYNRRGPPSEWERKGFNTCTRRFTDTHR